MYAGTRLLNDDGSASIATAILMSHHGFRRDIARFTLALGELASGGRTNVEALREQWKTFRATLHGHHEAEDNQLFPSLRGQVASLAPVIERLNADHRRIDPLLANGDSAFEELPQTERALGVINELARLLEPHLQTEETEIFPVLRDAKQFPPAASAEEEAQYAEGFAWASHGVAPDVLDRVDAMLPESLRSKLPAARAAFQATYEKAFGPQRGGAARTSLPDV